MPKWIGGLTRNYIYIPDGGSLAEKFEDAFIKQLAARGNILSAEKSKISTGFFMRKERPAIKVKGLGMSATVTAIPIGPDLYVGYVIWAKPELNDLEKQDLEAFSGYLSHTISLALKTLKIAIA
jgi:hypothetical protein